MPPYIDAISLVLQSTGDATQLGLPFKDGYVVAPPFWQVPELPLVRQGPRQ